MRDIADTANHILVFRMLLQGFPDVSFNIFFQQEPVPVIPENGVS